MEQFSGHRVICIQQDYAAGLFVANLQSLIEKQCEDHLDQVNKKTHPSIQNKSKRKLGIIETQYYQAVLVQGPRTNTVATAKSF